MSRTWIHVDLDAFYAAVEIRDDPSLRDEALAVTDRGMVMTANYKAREYGIRSGIPNFVAHKLCPKLITKKPDFDNYRKVSSQFKEILMHYDPALESIGLDEANLDITNYLANNKLND